MHDKRSIIVEIRYDPRTEGPLWDTHNWNLRLHVGGLQVYNGYYYTREAAIEDSINQLEIKGIASEVNVVKDFKNVGLSHAEL